MRRQWRKRRVGLALGSGGARGWAHLGVLETLQERGIDVEVVAGTSMGAVVGAFFSAGRVSTLRDLAMNTPHMRVMMTRDSDYFVPLWTRVMRRMTGRLARQARP